MEGYEGLVGRSEVLDGIFLSYHYTGALRSCIILLMDVTLWQKAGMLRLAHNLKVIDAIHAASALHSGGCLWTNG